MTVESVLSSPRDPDTNIGFESVFADVDQSRTAVDMANETLALLNAGMDALEECDMDAAGPSAWAALYVLRFAHAHFKGLYSRIHADCSHLQRT